MAHRKVKAAFRARLTAAFPALALFGENQQPVPPADGSPFMVLQFPHVVTRWESADAFTEEGGARLALHVRAGGGTEAGEALLDDVATLFQGAEFADVQCFAPTSPVTDDSNDRAGFWRMSIVVPYEFTVEA